ncbi:hypothetical protein U6V54_12180, partial [Cutibacterium acnes]
CLENPMDRGAWQAAVYRVTKSQIRLSKEHTKYLKGASQVALVVKNPPANAGDVEMWVKFLSWEDPLEKGIATHSSILFWRIPCAEEHGATNSQTQLSD